MPRRALVLAAGCARFEPRPISPEDSAKTLETRGLDSPEIRGFLEDQIGARLKEWPMRSWNLDYLTLAAFFFNPDLAVARAQWAGAEGSERTAAQRPNPTLNVTPGFNATTMAASPWYPSRLCGHPD